MDYSLANILCVEDIRTGCVCEDGIIGKDGYFTDYMEYAAEAVARGDMSELVHGRLDGIGYLEMKKPGGKQSKEQMLFEGRCREYGVSYDLAHSVEEVEAIIEWHRRKG